MFFIISLPEKKMQDLFLVFLTVAVESSLCLLFLLLFDSKPKQCAQNVRSVVQYSESM